ncbi:MAG TPA: signal recognition particle-docking protein FtsY [Polyangia bacterium]|nr:signal recognition particle-docking protein FtsY [Polyangia bacterium]
MDLSSIHLSATELYELIGVVGGLGVTGTLGVLFVRRARDRRRRQIEESDGPPALGRPERSTGERAGKAPRPADRLAAEPQPEPEPRGRERGGAAPTRAPEHRPLPPPSRDPDRAAQVIPFPSPATEPQPEPAPKKKANALAPGLARTRSGFVARLGAVFTGRKQIDPAVVDEIEKVLLTADIGVKTSQKLLEEIRSSLSRSELKDPDAVWAFLRQRSTEMLSLPAPEVDFGSAKPFVLLVIGVNGSGKTTTIGKLAARLAGQGKKVLMAAGDTFRAAAAEQLEVWAGRTGAAIVRGKEGADPSSVIFDGIKRAATEGFDVAIADTAGRLHTKTDLMQELQKVRRVLGKATPGAPHETWLVIDSTSGQNAIAQAQIFTEAMAVSGIVLTKLDGTAKGGVILGIADQLKIPVRYVGIGESVEDLRPFDPTEFVEALFAPLES